MSNSGTKRTTLKDVNKDRFAFMFASLVGRKVSVKVRNLSIFEGVFSGSTMEKGEYTVLLNNARELPSETRLSGPVHDQMLIPGKEVLSMTGLDVPEDGLDVAPSEDKPKEFRTDAEINTRRFQSRGERQLESWADLREDHGPGHHDTELETHSAGWSSAADQFVVAKQMGVVSTYREELYTTPLNMDSLTKEQRERAERLAKEIEGGRNYSSQEEGGDGDEEAMFSAVVGTGAYKKQQHPADTASSWRRSEEPPQAVRGSNTRLNALNLEPATVRAPPVDPKPPAATKPVPPPPRPASPTGVSEMKGINALNLEPAAVTRAPAWDAKYKATAARAAPGAAAVSQPTKKDFEIALAEIKSRESRGKPAKRGGAVSPSGEAVSPQGGAAQTAAAAAGGKFSFNPNASTFTPGGAAAPGAPALSIAITPGGSLSGTLKAATAAGNYDYYEPTSGVPPPMPPPPMVLYPPPPFGMPMMAPPPMGPPPSFAPLCEAGQLDRVTVSETLSRYMEKTSSSSSSSSVSWTSKNDKGISSYKDILGNVPAGIGPVMPPPAAMMPPHPMMMPPMMAGPMYGIPAGYAPYYPPPPVAMPVGGGGGPRRGMPYGGYPPQQQHGGGYGRYRGNSGHASSTPAPSE